MAIQRLVLDSIFEDAYELMAIHSSLPPHRLAFLLNKYVDIRLSRTKNDVLLNNKGISASFPLFQYEDVFQYCTFSLVRNTCKTQNTLNSTNNNQLFTMMEESSVITYLIPEYKSVDYFLKIETETNQFFTKSLTSTLLSIPQVITAYAVDCNQLKSKNNLIFE